MKGRLEVSCVMEDGEYKAGDPRPEGYSQWYEWAQAQDEAGLLQSQCPDCKLWHFPQEEPHNCKEV